MARKSKHSKEVRAGAVKMVREDGRSATEVAESLGIKLPTLNYWLQAEKQKQSPQPLAAEERQELLRLRAELKELKEDNTI